MTPDVVTAITYADSPPPTEEPNLKALRELLRNLPDTLTAAQRDKLLILIARLLCRLL
jgi:hypothetical protein